MSACVRRIDEVRYLLTDDIAHRATCACGWGGKTYATKRDAASAWGMHAAAIRRRDAS